MPKISINAHHDVKELKNIKLANQSFKSYYFDKIYEIVKLDIDETGVKVENEGVIMLKKCVVKQPVKKPKCIILDQPFWIVMKEVGKKNPYFIAYINDLSEK